ncbi:NAD-dependent epimerase/dehydratase family protein [Ectobacillus polymachus]|uniref:NAD-dependent epimerase/dehydratase family protein n=1 Tax=Ectobacillus polymachus TaxID=1508806 RepID=UPI003A89DA4F
MDKDYHVIFGTGPLGIAVMEQLIKQNKKVLMVNTRGKEDVPKNVQVVKGDATNLKSVLDICTSYPVSVIYHCIGLPYQSWKKLYPIMMANLIEAAAKSGAKIVYGDNLYAYGPHPEALNENLSYIPVGAKTKVRAEVATKLMNAHKEGKVKATIGRATDFYGPRVKNSILGERVFKNLLENKPVDMLGNPDTIHSQIYIHDFARGLVTLSEHEQAYGEIWHIPSAQPTTNRELVQKIARQIGIKPKYRVAGKLIVTIVGFFNSNIKEFRELMYQHEHNFIVDSSKFQKAFTFSVTPHEEAIQKTIDWYQDHI